MPYRVLLAEQVVEFLRKLDRKEQERDAKRIEKLSTDPVHFGENRGDFWLLKMGRGGYRVAYRFSKEEGTVRVLAAERRSGTAYERRFCR
ncbi:MAG: hypothetical protein QXT68_00430 [Halobacteria archaeon]